MKIVRALYYQYYWWQMRSQKDSFLVPLLATFCLMIPFAAVIGSIMIFSDATDFILMGANAKIIFYSVVILEFAVLWWLFLRNSQYKSITEDHDVYDLPLYRRIAIMYPVISTLFFFFGLYIGYLHHSAMST